MSAAVRSRPARRGPEEDRSLYARVLGLRHVRPSEMLCFFFIEGAIALATLLALAELVTWWAVVVLPGTIAAMVKINDVIAGFGARTATLAPAAGDPTTAAHPDLIR